VVQHRHQIRIADPQSPAQRGRILEPALRLLKADAPVVVIGLIMPLRQNSTQEGKVPNTRYRLPLYQSSLIILA